MKTSSPPLENRGSNALDGPMKSNPGVNTEPDMGESLAKPKPSLVSGFSKGSLMVDDSENTTTKNPFKDSGYYDDDY